MTTTARGQHLERLAQACLESRGWLVERARNVIRWLPDKKTGLTRPVSLHHDFFGKFDGVYVTQDGFRGFYQVTTEDNFHARRHKILAFNVPQWSSEPQGKEHWRTWSFPVTPEDVILAHRRGTRIFRVARGPLFLLPEAEEWTAPKLSTRSIAT